MKSNHDIDDFTEDDILKILLGICNKLGIDNPIGYYKEVKIEKQKSCEHNFQNYYDWDPLCKGDETCTKCKLRRHISSIDGEITYQYRY